MSARVACLKCGSANQRIGYGTRDGSGQTVALRTCGKCGYWTRTMLGGVEAVQLLSDRVVEVIDQREAA